MSGLANQVCDACRTADAVRAELFSAKVPDLHLAIIQHSGYAIIATDPAGTILHLNPAAQKLLGYQPDEVVGLHTPLIFHLKDEVLAYARRSGYPVSETDTSSFGLFVEVLKAILPGEHCEAEWTFVRKDGGTFPVSLAISHLHDSSGESIGYLGVANDISRRRAMELELRVAATAFESQAAILVTDAEQRILRINSAFTHLTGYSPEEAVGQHPSLLKSGRQDSSFYAEMWASLNDKGHWQGEIWNRRKNGEVFPEWLTISAVHDASGQLTNYVSTFSDISNLKLAESEIHHLAFYDPLTNLPNRRLLLNRLHKAQLASSRSHEFGALLIIDLDNFKTLNDTLGHDVGDRLLMEVAHRLKHCVRESDTAARQGGDEFAVMLNDLGCDPAGAGVYAESVAEKIRAKLGQPYTLGGHLECFHTASIGVSLFCGQDKTIEALLKQADIALYKSKEAGRNTVRFFDAAMQTALEVRAHLEHGLRQALKKNEFRVLIQPQVDRCQNITGAEVLLRWYPEGQRMVSPADFIPLAEETGLIVPIGLWVLHQACAHLHDWQNEPLLRDLTLAVNVSPRQFRQPDFVEQVRGAVEQYGINPGRLKLELTESLLLDAVEEVVGKMNELRRLGIRFSLDDFGTGYASLSYLKRFPFEQLKVDRSFVRDIASDPDDAAIVRAIIAMGNTLRLNVVAEGVEQMEQYDYLVEHGCTALQGYLFGRPMTLLEFEQLVAGVSSKAPQPVADFWMI